MITNPLRPHVRRRALYAIRALVECDSSMSHWLSTEVSRCLRDKDDTVVGCAITICGGLYKVRQNRSALQHGGLMFPEWIGRTRCTRTCIPGLAPLREILHRVSRSDVGNPESPAAIFHRSVSPCGFQQSAPNDMLGTDLLQKC